MTGAAVIAPLLCALLASLVALAPPAAAQSAPGAPATQGSPGAGGDAPLHEAHRVVRDEQGAVLDEQGFVRATPGRPLVLPADHGSHPETRTEWWYLTGELHAGSAPAADGGVAGGGGVHDADFGFQATWFRRALVAELPAGRSPLAARDVMLFHGALSDIANGALSFHEQSCRAYGPWAHAAAGTLDVTLLGNSLRTLGASAPLRGADAPPGAGTTHLHCRVGDGELDAVLDLAACAPLLHGREPGLSLKGELPGQASWYYSLPRVALHGTLRRPGREDLAVAGRAWFDHEFGSSQLAPEQAGWDWFSVALDDGSDLMLYRMRLAGGGTGAASSGTFRTGAEPDAGADPRGGGRHLSHEEFSFEETASWTSPRTGARYPSGWNLSVPGEQLLLHVQPVLADQELVTPGSTGVTYWEGLCRFTGTRAGRPVRGEGYVELVGYAARFRERL